MSQCNSKKMMLVFVLTMVFSLLPLSSFGSSLDLESDPKLRFAYPNEETYDFSKQIYDTDSSFLLAELDTEKQPDPPITLEEPQRKELLPMLPFLKDKAAEAGEVLPLSLGVGLVYLRIDRDIVVNDISVGTDPNSLVSINDFISVDVGVEVQNATLRVDTWIFPFLNAYLLGGEIRNKSDVLFTVNVQSDVTRPVTNPSPPPLVINEVILPAGSYSMPSQGALEGEVYGGGITLAAGYKRFFLTLDNNYTVANVGAAFDYKINTLTSSVRTGVRDTWRNINWRLWVGGTRWDTDRNLDGSFTVDVAGTPRTLYFSVDQEPVTKENYIAGANVEINPHFNIVLEFGFKDDMRSLLAGLNTRF
jgi:hypothetical protein